MSETLGSIGERVAHLQSLSGLDRAELSKLAGLAQSHVGLIMRGGVKNPAGSTLGAIAKVTGASTDWIITGAGAPPTDDVVKAAVEAAKATTPNAVA